MRNDTLIALLGISKIMYEGKIVNLINLETSCRAGARHFAPRARPGGAESTDVSVYRDIRPFKFEFCAWVLTEHDRWSSMGTLTFGPDSVATGEEKSASITRRKRARDARSTEGG